MNIFIANKKMIPSVSTNKRCLVLLSAYNGKQYIEEQIESIVKQKGVELDILVRDDGSKDDTVAIVEKIKASHSHHIRIIKGENVGIHNSFAELVEMAPDGYDYYLFADQDDIWDDNKVYIAISMIKYYNVPFYWGCARLVDNKGRILNKTTSNPKIFDFYMNSEHKVMTPGVQGCTMVMSASFFKIIKESGFPEKYGHDTWIPIVANYLCGGVYDSVPRMNYRQHDSSWTGNRSKKIKQIKTDLRYFFMGLSRHFELANDILLRYKNKLTEEEIGYLSGLADRGTFFERVKNINRYHYAKDSSLKTFVFRMYYLFIH